MKKCPECGNPSYDGAPVCGNCGYKFPKAKVVVPKREDIFQQDEKIEKKSDNEDTISILKEKKLVIGAILIITLIIICGIVLTGSNTNNTSTTTPIQIDDLEEYSQGDFSFKYPKSWNEINMTDVEHPGAKFFKNEDGVIIEYYNVTTSATSLKEITSQRIDYAQENGAYVELVETVTLDGRNASNILLENADGNYTRYVSMFSDGELYVFKLSGESENSVNAADITDTINSADIA